MALTTEERIEVILISGEQSFCVITATLNLFEGMNLAENSDVI